MSHCRYTLVFSYLDWIWELNFADVLYSLLYHFRLICIYCADISSQFFGDSRLSRQPIILLTNFEVASLLSIEV